MVVRAAGRVNMKKWLITVLAGIIVTPILAFSWGNIASLWAAPQKISKIEEVVAKQQESQDKLTEFMKQQEAELDKTQAVQEAQLESVKEQLSLIAELKKGKR